LRTRRALIVGAGVAGLSCAELIARQGWEVEVWGTAPRLAPTLILNELTCNLLREVWPGEDDLFAGAAVLDERRVCWGPQLGVETVTEGCVAITSDRLLARLLRRLSDRHAGRLHVDYSSARLSYAPDPDVIRRLAQEFNWIVDSTGRASRMAVAIGGTQNYPSGNRCMMGMEVTLTATTEPRACWLETVPDGWLFLTPLGSGRGFLQGMVPLAPDAPAAMLADLVTQTRIIRRRVAESSGRASAFAAAPRMSDPLCGPGWIAVGEAAIALDPLSGEGVGHAVRGAILAAGVLEGIASGLPVGECLRHYTLRLHRTFCAHLRECLRYYTFAFRSALWATEIERMRRSFPLETCRAASAARLAYGLRGFRLVPLAG
jgi:flavin-dependent dehydrogenase